MISEQLRAVCFFHACNPLGAPKPQHDLLLLGLPYFLVLAACSSLQLHVGSHCCNRDKAACLFARPPAHPFVCAPMYAYIMGLDEIVQLGLCLVHLLFQCVPARQNQCECGLDVRILSVLPPHEVSFGCQAPKPSTDRPDRLPIH